ncbi:hypothetical protein CRG98_031809 [Punica granatum]|uniref:Uncharacterized protein n=1 Tax=Punica granatum TaxID=22663 RepID=A0A2I0IV37_PUNGR|nr:hypothetical protein CRG98_031809 [Punica granatum]
MTLDGSPYRGRRVKVAVGLLAKEALTHLYGGMLVIMRNISVGWTGPSRTDASGQLDRGRTGLGHARLGRARLLLATGCAPGRGPTRTLPLRPRRKIKPTRLMSNGETEEEQVLFGCEIELRVSSVSWGARPWAS